MTGSSGSSDRHRTSSRIGYILSVAFQCHVLSSVDFLRWCGSIVMSKCIPICVHRQHTKHWHRDSWYLNGSLFCVCAGTWVGLIFWVPGTPLVSQWYRLPLRGHQSHFPCICSRWHLGSTLSWRRMVLLWHGAVRWYMLMCCIIQMTKVIAFNVCFKASAPGLTLSPKAWHGIMDHFPREVSTLFPSHVQQICLWNIYSIYINTYKPSTCWPSHTICPRSSTLMYGHTLFFLTINNNGSCSLQHIHSKDHDMCPPLCLKVHILADREGHCHL